MKHKETFFFIFWEVLIYFKTYGKFHSIKGSS